MIIIVLIGIIAFAYWAIHAGEQRGTGPGIARPLTIGVIVLAAWLLWPVYAPAVSWLLPR